jgi:hypothetical protein
VQFTAATVGAISIADAKKYAAYLSLTKIYQFFSLFTSQTSYIYYLNQQKKKNSFAKTDLFTGLL